MAMARIGQSERAHRPEVGRGDVAGRGVAGGGPAGDVDEDAAIFEVGLELGPGGGGRGIGGGKHRAGAGFFEMAAERWIVVGGFLDEPGDLAAGEEFFEVEELLEVQAAGDDQNAGGGDAVLVEDLGGRRRTLRKIGMWRDSKSRSTGIYADFSRRGTDFLRK